jgi:hypothetical protein
MRFLQRSSMRALVHPPPAGGGGGAGGGAGGGNTLAQGAALAPGAQLVSASGAYTMPYQVRGRGVVHMWAVLCDPPIFCSTFCNTSMEVWSYSYTCIWACSACQTESG